MAKKQTSEREDRAVAFSQIAPDADVRARVWELHLRGVPRTRIGQKVGLDRHTVARMVADGYREVGADQRAEKRRMLDGAVARMRRIQEQAWDYCDADDARERSVLEAAVPGTRYQSQRGQYLKVILDAEKEISRLEGLYESLGEAEGAVVFRIIREVSDGSTAFSDALVSIADGRRPDAPTEADDDGE